MPDTSQFPALDGTLGAMEIGAILGTFLFGIETLQTFNYYRRFPEDSKLLKATVTTIVSYLHKQRLKDLEGRCDLVRCFDISEGTNNNRLDYPSRCLELVNTICGLGAIYTMTITFYGHAPNQHILNPPHTLNITILLSAPINALVQLFFGNRIRVLSGHWHIMVLCVVLTLLRFICDVALTIAFWVSPLGFSVLRANDHWEMITASSVGPAVDGLIAVSMCFCLWRVRRSGFKRTQRMVDTLIVWTVGAPIVVAGIMQLFLACADLSFMAFFFIQPKLFSNSMLASLNGRQRLRLLDQGETVSLSLELAHTPERTKNGRVLIGDERA
ncbi:hypothetical protein B0H11DRAFT_2037497 [Mycena galericulata]|nr:hypothetical protein B0H11DRAFT_2037497 [Mycena galericulata]